MAWLMKDCSYLPGDVCIFFSSRIVHKVETFIPLPQTPDEASQGITPGRIGTVLFFPKDTLELLRGKGPEWAVKTAHGRYEHLYPAGTFVRKEKEKRKGKGKGGRKDKRNQKCKSKKSLSEDVARWAEEEEWGGINEEE
jgi:hypothetical protein